VAAENSKSPNPQAKEATNLSSDGQRTNSGLQVQREKIRVDLAAYDYPGAMSGPVSWAQRLPLLLQEFGIEVRVLLLHWGDTADGVLLSALTSQGVAVRVCHFGNTDANVRFLLNAISLDPPDVFIANHVTPALLVSGYLRSHGIPSVAVLRSDDAFYHGVIDLVVGGRVRDQVSAVVCVSKYLADCVRRRNSAMKCIRIPSGTPIPQRCAVAGERLRLVYSGRLVDEQKQITATVEAFILACREFPDLEVVILGDGPERTRLERRVAESGAAIHFLGRLAVDSMHDELIRSHVVVLLSDYEGLPGAVVEGMASGLVPICLRMRSGADELIQHGVNGFICADRGTDFVDCVRRLHASWELWSEMSMLARRSIIENFSLAVVSERWASLIVGLARMNSGKSAEIASGRIDLPPVHPALLAEDIRPERVTFLQSFRRKLVKRFKRLFTSMSDTAPSA
jgi:colanic acid/amylovoran biosynthesis glycosyltransferase